MKHEYNLTLDDHLAWYDYCRDRENPGLLSRLLPALHAYNERQDRSSYGSFVLSDANAKALGPRTLELSPSEVHECVAGFEFSTGWDQVALVEISATHLFIAHHSMNAHIVPLASFYSDEKRDAFIACAASRGRNLPNQSLEPTPTSVTSPAGAGAAPAVRVAHL